MKAKIILFFGLLVMAGCSSDGDAVYPTTDRSGLTEKQSNNPKNTIVPNKVLLLKVDFETHVFEGGKTLSFNTSNSFTIASQYQSPGDFGGITLRYAETDQMLFSGTIHWMGLGAMNYPESLNPAASFQTISIPVLMPHASLLETVDYTEFAYYPDPVPYEAIWQSIDQLQVVAQFRASNPNAKVHVFLYTPSVCIGNPADWDYFVMLKN